MRSITTYRMPAEAEALGFAIRDQSRITRTERPHRHEFFQMRLDVAGEADHHIGSRRRLLRPGSLSFVTPYRMHRGGRRAESEFYVINFHHRFVRPGLALDLSCLDGVAVSGAPELAPFAFQEFLDFRLDGVELRVARDACRAMLDQYRARRFFSADLIRANLLLLIGTACQRYERQLSRLSAATAERSTRRDALGRVVRYIGGHLADDVALADVAAAADLSPNYVSQLLKKETGKTFVDFLTALRLQKAQELLANTALRIAEISAAVGYVDEAYFARRFRQFLRVSPREYRRRAMANAGSP
jgi:AraC-like DNA-binding protein